jgi:hypothetical protein
MSDLENQWTDKIAKLLVGKTITKVRYMTEHEMDGHGWYQKALMIYLHDGTVIYPSCDDEGNEAGALFTNIEAFSTIPTLRGES